jgi:Right handed beta helix region
MPLPPRKWTRQAHSNNLLPALWRGLCVLATGLVMATAGFAWGPVPGASAGTTTLAPTSTRLFVVAGSATATVFRAKVTGVSSTGQTPTGSVAFTVDGSPLECDGLPTDSVPMTGGVATCRVSPAVPPSGSPATAVATYSGDGTFFASNPDELTESDGNFAPSASRVVTPPTSIPDDCSSDAEPALFSWLSSLPQGTASNPLVVKLPAQACYEIDESLDLEGMTDTVVYGQGAALEQTTPSMNPQPVVNLWQDTNLTVENLTIEGAYNGSNGGEGDEGDYGLVLEGASGVYLSHLSVTNIQGDFIYLSPPYDLGNDDALNTNVKITNSTFTNAGYHGLTVESVNGFMVANDVFDGMGTDAMDFEYDDYSTPFNPDGTPYWAAQDNVLIENNTWTDWSGDWFVSDQGQTPGVQEQDVTLTGNTLSADSPLFEIVGTDALTTTAPYLNSSLTITDNQFAPGYYAEPYRGGTSVASSIYNVSNLFMEDNTFPLCAGTYEAPQPASDCSAPDEDELDLFGITNGVVADNDFAGALGILQPQDYLTQLVDFSECGNEFGVNAGLLDAVCASTTG